MGVHVRSIRIHGRSETRISVSQGLEIHDHYRIGRLAAWRYSFHDPVPMHHDAPGIAADIEASNVARAEQDAPASTTPASPSARSVPRMSWVWREGMLVINWI
ncbi:MAG: hypothetical protein WDN25_14060 [Acetobacteraceae bacterium]